MDLAASVQTWLWARYPLQTLALCQRWMGEGFKVSVLGGRQMLIVSDPASVERLFKRAPQAGNDELAPFLGASSLFLLKGDAHAAERRLLHGAVARLGGSIDFGGQLKLELAAAGPALGRRDPLQLFRLAALKGMAQMCFGAAADVAGLLAASTVLFRRMSAWAMFSHGGKIKDRALSRSLAQVRAEILALVADPDVKGRPDSYVATAAAGGAADDAIVDEVCTLLSAGSEPLASSLLWALHFAERSPSIAARLDDELASAEGAFARGHAPPFLDAVCKETLRFMPVVPVVDRVVTEPFELADVRLQVGDRVAACSYLTHRREDVFAEAGHFAPDRFLAQDFSPFAYYPFGGGVRRCIGANLVARLLPEGIAAFRSRYVLEPQRAPSIDMKGIVLSPRGHSIRPKCLVEGASTR